MSRSELRLRSQPDKPAQMPQQILHILPVTHQRGRAPEDSLFAIHKSTLKNVQIGTAASVPARQTSANAPADPSHPSSYPPTRSSPRRFPFRDSQVHAEKCPDRNCGFGPSPTNQRKCPSRSFTSFQLPTNEVEPQKIPFSRFTSPR